jgi:hypothetical protein
LAASSAGCSGTAGPAALPASGAGAAPAAGTLSVARSLALSPNVTATSNPNSKIGHVFVVMLENKDESVTYSSAGAPYLNSVVKRAGVFVPGYYATGHASLDNYISLISGQAPNVLTSSDCPYYLNFVDAVTTTDGQAAGTGCVFPDTVPNITDQLRAANIPWKSYNEDMGNDPTRESATCGHPTLNSQDMTQDAEGPDADNGMLGDQYATRHDPFMYFHSIIDDEAYCQEHVVNASHLATDLKTIETTPNFVFYTPNLCNDGHDSGCVAPGRGNSTAGGYTGIDYEMRYLVPLITRSKAFKKDGLLVIIFDEADTSDTTTCCGEEPGPTDPDPGEEGLGGGKVGAMMLSPFFTPNTTSMSEYNHYALLGSIEDIFGLGRIGYAEASGLNSIVHDPTIMPQNATNATDVGALVTHPVAFQKS